MKIRLSGKLKNLLFLSAVFLTLNSLNAAAIKESVSGKPVDDATIAAGKTIFEGRCASCHALNNKLVGPALKDVHKRRNYDWLTKWIRNNEDLRKSGDKDAIAVFEANNKSVMSVFTDLKDDDIAAVVMYIEDASAGGGAAAAPKADGVQTNSDAISVQPADPKTVSNINWIMIFLFVLIIAILFLIVKIIDQVSAIRGKEVIKWNKVNGYLMLAFMIIGFAACWWEFKVHGALRLPEAGTEHGRKLDEMFNITLFFTMIVFVITQFLLFYFGFKYRGRKGNKALYYPHNNKIEVIWTTIPAIVLTVLVIGGLKTWRSITNNPERNKFNIELFAYQFGWTARYPGDDGKLGNANWNLISNDNQLGVAIKEQAETLLIKLEEDIKDLEKQKKNLPNQLGELTSAMGGLVGEERAAQMAKVEEIKDGTALNDLEKTINNRKIQIGRIKASLESNATTNFYDNSGMDDIILNNEIHIPVNKTVTFKIRSRDVIHSVYMPMFRSQINAVPGLPTEIVLKAIETTKDKKVKLNDPNFEYWLICAKICGAAHFNMKMKIVVDSEADYKAWISKQTAAFAKKQPAAPEAAPSTTDTTKKTLALN